MESEIWWRWIVIEAWQTSFGGGGAGGNLRWISMPFRERNSSFTRDPLEWPISYFSLQYHIWIKHQGHENKGNDNQPKDSKFLIVKQILLISTLGNVRWQYREYAYWCKGEKLRQLCGHRNINCIGVYTRPTVKHYLIYPYVYCIIVFIIIVI